MQADLTSAAAWHQSSSSPFITPRMYSRRLARSISAGERAYTTRPEAAAAAALIFRFGLERFGASA
jgi:hypothetical protein